MEIQTTLTLIFVLLVVWGGLIYFIRKALKYEKLKKQNGEG